MRVLPLFLAVANDTAKKLLARVKALREARGLSQEAFSEKAGLGYKYYQHVEAGRRRDLRLSTLEKLAAACGLEIWELLNFDVEPIPVVDAGPKSGSAGTPANTTRNAHKSRARKSPAQEAG